MTEITSAVNQAWNEEHGRSKAAAETCTYK